jgi:hypothetical protein
MRHALRHWNVQIFFINDPKQVSEIRTNIDKWGYITLKILYMVKEIQR